MPFDYRKPGVYVEESLLVNSADTASATSVALFVGAAGTGSVDTPIRCDTWSDYVLNFGNFDEITNPITGTKSAMTYLPYAVYSYFQNGGRPCYVKRAIGSSTGTSASYVVTGTSTNTTSTRTASVSNKVLTSGTATLTTSAAHGFAINDTVAITGVDTTFNGTNKTITAVGTNTFSYAIADRTATVSKKALASNVVTITTAAAHAFLVGDKVTLSGGTLGSPFVVTDATITATPTTTTFRYSITGTNTDVAETTSTGTATVSNVATTAVSPVGTAVATRITTHTTPFTVQATSVGTSGNDIGITITTVDTSNDVFSVVVYNSGVEIERFQYLTMAGDVPGTRRADTAINDPYSGSTLIRLSAFDSAIVPNDISVITNLTSGTDPSLPDSSDYPSAAQSAVTKIEGPIIVNLVGYTTDRNSTEAYVTPGVVSSSTFPERGDLFIINDSAPPRTYGQTSTQYKSQINSSLSQNSGDSYVASFTPWIIIANPKQAGATITVPPGGAIAGVMSRIDSTIGVFRAPAGLVASISNAVGVDTKYSDTELGDLNSANINVIRPVAGAGIAIMGARTRKIYGADRYISARRTLIYIKESMRRSTQFALFENNDQRLWTQLRMTSERLLRPLWEAGGLRGNNAAEAYYIKCDATLNTPAVIASGEVRMEIGVALEYPAEFIVIRVTQFESGGFTAQVQPQG